MHQVFLHGSANQFNASVPGSANITGEEAKERYCSVCTEPNPLPTTSLEAPERENA